MVRICIVGGSIIGLTTAYRLCVELGHKDITIISEDFPPFTTASNIVGLLEPIFVAASEPAKVRRWARETFDFAISLMQRGLCAETGVMYVNNMEFVHRGTKSNVGEENYLDDYINYRKLKPAEMAMYNIPTDGTWDGHIVTTGNIEPLPFMRWILQQLRQAGVKFEKQKVHSIIEVTIAGNYDVIFNCTGYGAGELCGDKKMHVMRGQVMKVHAPFVTATMVKMSDECGVCYILKGQNYVILGGTCERDDHSSIPRRADRERILKGCAEMIPSLATAPITAEWVGFRPFRDGDIRIEAEQVGKSLVIHHYGHGGSGPTLCYGTAGAAILLAKDVLQHGGAKL